MYIMRNIILATLLLTLGYSCSSNDEKSDAYGNFETEEVLLSAETLGKIIQLRVDEGSSISFGDTLAQIDTTTLSLQKDQLNARKNSVLAQKPQLKAQIEVSNQQVANLEREIARIRKMYKDGAATQKQKDDAEGQLLVLKRQIDAINVQISTLDANIAEINAQQKILQKQINDCSITAPIPGVILNKYTELGELVSPGKIIFKMANLETLNLRVFISGNQLASIQLGDNITVLTDDKAGMFSDQGKITWISPKAEFTPKTIQTRDERVDMVYAVKIKVNNSGRYKIGMPAEIRFNK